MRTSSPIDSTSGPSAPQSKKVLGIVFFTVFLDLVGFGILIPIQPFYAESLGASPVTISLLGASFSLMQFLFAPFWGKLSDRIGRRPVMLVSIAAASIGYLSFALSQTLPLLFLSRMLAGFGSANIGTAQAIIADSTDAKNRAKGMGLIGAAFGLGFIFGPAIGGAFSQMSLVTPLFVASSLSALNWVFAFFCLPETHPNPGASPHLHRGLSLESLKKMAGSGQVARVFVLYFVFTTAFALMEQVLGLFIERNWTTEFSGNGLHGQAKHAAALTTYVLVTVGVTATIVQGGLIGRLVRKFGERALLVLGTALVAVSFFLIPFAGMWGVFSALLFIAFLMAFGSGITSPSLSSLLSQLVDPKVQGEALGTGQSLSALGRIVGPSTAGFLFQASINLPFWIGAALLAGCSILAANLTPSSKKR